MNKRSTLKLAACAVAIAAAFGMPTLAQAQTKLKFAHVYETSEPYHKWSVWAGDEIKKRTNGRYEVQVFPASYSPLRLLAETMRFFAEESCQKCTPCRIGNRALHAVFEGERTMSREQVDEWLEAMALTSICGLGQAAPIPVRSAFAHWPELFEKMTA